MGELGMSRSTTTGSEPLDGIGSNVFLLGRRMGECFGETMPILEDESDVTSRISYIVLFIFLKGLVTAMILCFLMNKFARIFVRNFGMRGRL